MPHEEAHHRHRHPVPAVALFCACVTTASALTGAGRSLCSSAATACAETVESAGTALGLKMGKIARTAGQIADEAAATANRFVESDESEEKAGKAPKKKAKDVDA